MENLFNTVTDLIMKMVSAVIVNYQHNWIPLSLAVLTAAVMSAYVDPERLKEALLRRTNVSIWASVVIGAFTPLCACGTMAVILGMLTATLPWGPVMAFLTSSPLMSPDGFVLNAGLIGPEFAIALTTASIVIGLGSGYLTHLIEKKSNFLKNQTRFFKEPSVQTGGCGTPAPVQACGCAAPSSACCRRDPANLPAAAEEACCGNLRVELRKNKGLMIWEFLKKVKWREIANGLINTGLKQILFYFTIFVAIGRLITCLAPTSLIVNLFGAGKFYGVPLAALIGLPLYVSTEASLPIIKPLLAGGAGGGPMLAFMITGLGTSAWVVAGMATFMKKRALALYVLYILSGGILCGYLYDLFLALGK